MDIHMTKLCTELKRTDIKNRKNSRFILGVDKVKRITGIIILLVMVIVITSSVAFASEDNVNALKIYFVANSDIIDLVEYGHVEKNAFEGEGFYNDALYGLLAISMIVDGSDEYDLYGLNIDEFAASEDDDGVMFALPLQDSHFIMRVSFDTYVIEMYESNRNPRDYSAEDVLRLVSYENGYSDFSSRIISKDVVDYVFND